MEPRIIFKRKITEKLLVWKNESKGEKTFYLFHELRHAEQYAHPERFPPAIRKALDYEIDEALIGLKD